MVTDGVMKRFFAPSQSSGGGEILFGFFHPLRGRAFHFSSARKQGGPMDNPAGVIVLLTGAIEDFSLGDDFRKEQFAFPQAPLHCLGRASAELHRESSEGLPANPGRL